MPVINGTFDFQGGDVTTDTSVGASPFTGTLTEQGVTFTFSASVPPNGNANFSTLAFNLSVSASGATAGTATATLDLNDTPSEDFFSNPVFNFGGSVSGSNQIQLIRTLNPTNGSPTAPVTVTITNAQINANGSAAAPAGQYNEIRFITSAASGDSFMVVNSIETTINCFLSGTTIATDTGARAVETLKPGDLLRTADGRLEAVIWLGEMEIDTRLMHPAKVNPICITAGALGNGLPERDLRLSADHAIEIDGVLYNAGALVNGTTIYQVAKMPMDGFTYYHVETQAHELLLAEGVAAESFIDYAGRDSFDNGGEAEPRAIPEMDLPRVSSARLVPDHIRTALAPAIAAE
jgi:hypothetical protein